MSLELQAKRTPIHVDEFQIAYDSPTKYFILYEDLEEIFKHKIFSEMLYYTLNRMSAKREYEMRIIIDGVQEIGEIEFSRVKR